MEMVGSGENITGEELLKRYAEGERNFPLISLYDEKCVLRGADLRGINMVGGYFAGGSLWNTNLSDSCLIGFDFNCMGFDGANFSHPDLTGACLWSAFFTNANFSNCILKGANLRKAILCNANLRGAVLDGANLADTDFTGAHFFIKRHMTGILFWNTTMPDGSVIEGPTFIN